MLGYGMTWPVSGCKFNAVEKATTFDNFPLGNLMAGWDGFGTSKIKQWKYKRHDHVPTVQLAVFN